MEIVGTGLTDVGLKRDHNEDAFLCDTGSRLFIVADGMGGMTAGETASKAVITVFPMILKEMLDSRANPVTPDNMKTILKEALCRLSQELYQQSQNIPEIRGLGSTVVILYIHGDTAYIACAGDSRVYLLRDIQLSQITEDQTIAAALVRTGYLKPESVGHHPLSHALEEYIGKEGALNPETWDETLQSGDRWLLCSDGLTKGIAEQELRELLLQSVSPKEACETLISTAKNTDGSDNITAIVVDVVSA